LKIMIAAVNKLITMTWKINHTDNWGDAQSFWKAPMSEKAIRWFLEKHSLHQFEHRSIELSLKKYEHMSCWGSCSQENKGHTSNYDMEIAVDQPLRNFIATIMHEMIHILQWETSEWEGDGEQEAEEKEYKLTDEFWKEGLL